MEIWPEHRQTLRVAFDVDQKLNSHPSPWLGFSLSLTRSLEPKGKPQFSSRRKQPRGEREAKKALPTPILVMCAACFNLWLLAIHYEYLMISLVRGFQLARSLSFASPSDA
jgi:hypothetical protein